MKSNIRVFVRSRPLLSNEARGKRCLSTSSDTVTLAEKKFVFESVFDENFSQSSIYEKSVHSLVEGCFSGFNATVFAYGQTGSGKTYSMMGSGVDQEAGMIPRAIQQIFSKLSSERDSGRIANVRVSMLEIYNDECKDLLHAEIPSRDIMIREDKDGRIFFTGAREEAVSDSQAAMNFLEQGNLNRTTAETYMNQTSSRSHAIFTVSIELLEYLPKPIDKRTGGGEVRAGSYIQAKLHMVDLAGSERAKRTGANGVRLKESVGINQGLLSLGKVIRALTSTPVGHVPYRESKLTRFLQDSLGGNSQTVMLACISSAECNVHETLSTLQYASRAKTIQNRVVANVSEGAELLNSELESSMVSALQNQVLQLQQQISHIQERSHLPPLPPQNGTSSGTITAAGMKRVLRVVAEIQQSLQICIKNVEESRATAESCGKAWQLVVVSREAVRTIQILVREYDTDSTASTSDRRDPSAVAAGVVDRMSSSMSYKSLRSSVSNLRNSATLLSKLAPTQEGLEEENEALRLELAECHEDLKRDEDIFAEKVRELKKAKKVARDLETTNRRLEDRLAELQEQLLKISKGGSTKTAFTYVPLNAEDKLELSVSTRNGAAVSKSTGATAEGNSEFDDLNISIAVAATEPDISQLMEDLEVISKEKEDLAVNSRRAEEKVESVVHSANTQRDEFIKGQAKLKQRLKKLEDDIHSKEDTIARLAESHSQAKEVADRQTKRAVDLERESEELRAQLKSLDSVRIRSAGDAEEERQHRLQYEKKLEYAQQQLQEMEAQREALVEIERRKRHSEEKNSAAESERAQQHLAELKMLKQERAQLARQMEEGEAQQRKAVEHLTRELSVHKQRMGESEERIRELERNNADLNAQLTSHKTANTAIVDEQKVKGWLTARINSINDAKISASEIARLQDVIAHLQAEKDDINKELQPILAQKMNYEEKLRRKIGDISGKIEKIHTKQSVLKQEILEVRRRRGDEEVKKMKCREIEGELSELEAAESSYEEHREECADRLTRGVLDEDALGRCAELQEELETVCTEIAVSEASIAQERLHMNRLQSVTLGGSALDNSLPVSGDHTAALLAELKLSLQGVSPDSPQLDSVLKQMLDVMVAEKFRVTSLDAAAKQIAAQLDDKNAEYDELVRTMQRTRNEFIRRQDQQRKESEDKIAFLLQQLRNAEARASVDHSAQSQANSVVSSIQSAARPKSSSSTLSSSMGRRRLSDNLLMEQAQQSSVGDLNAEMMRRWQAEKERREQLERRNGEMNRELRVLRESVLLAESTDDGEDSLVPGQQYSHK